jgi:hypothetical protein
VTIDTGVRRPVPKGCDGLSGQVLNEKSIGLHWIDVRFEGHASTAFAKEKSRDPNG